MAFSKKLSVLDNNINDRLHKLGWRQADLARDCKLKREYLNRIINRKITPTVPTALKISTAFGINIEDIFYIA